MTGTQSRTLTIEERYQNAAKLQNAVGDMPKIVLNASVLPHWISDHIFWYRRQTKAGDQFQLVDAKAGTNELAFDHEALATALSEATKKPINQDNLPITKVVINLSPLHITFTAFEQSWSFTADQILTSLQSDPVPSRDLQISPDGKKAAFVRDYNLWVRDLVTGKETSLTQDGIKFFEYASPSRAWGVHYEKDFWGIQAIWSPNSKKLFAIRVDNRQVLATPTITHVPKDGSIRPVLKENRVGFPGDEYVETNQLLAIDVEDGKVQAANYRQIPTNRSAFGLFTDGLGWWDGGSHVAYFVDSERGEKAVRVVEFDTRTGATRILFEELSDTYFKLSLNRMDSATLQPLPDSRELIWLSERSGWAHLYLYNLDTGQVKHPITQGNWLVRQVLHFDKDRRELWFQAAGRVQGRDPYYMDVCRVNIDTGDLKTLCSDDVNYTVMASRGMDYFGPCKLGWPDPMLNDSAVSPDGNYVVITNSRVDQLSASVLLDRDGNNLLILEKAETDGLPENWQWPQPVQLMAADKQTAVYGVVFKPSDFSPLKSYPIIDYSKSTAEYGTVPKNSFSSSHYLQAAAIAELGFVVVMIDGRGTAYREKLFVDASYGWCPKCNLFEDRIEAIRELGGRHHYIDLESVGVVASNANIGAVYGILEHPDFYKVSVSHGFTDPQLSSSIYGEYFEGTSKDMANYKRAEDLVDNLQGKLLLLHGMNDTMSHPAGTFRLVNALLKANKDFDLLLFPNEGVNDDGGEHIASKYAFRRTWDYLVQHLQGVEPPKEFDIESVSTG